jgi:hypothetical protein
MTTKRVLVSGMIGVVLVGGGFLLAARGLTKAGARVQSTVSRLEPETTGTGRAADLGRSASGRRCRLEQAR